MKGSVGGQPVLLKVRELVQETMGLVDGEGEVSFDLAMVPGVQAADLFAIDMGDALVVASVQAVPSGRVFVRVGDDIDLVTYDPNYGEYICTAHAVVSMLTRDHLEEEARAEQAGVAAIVFLQGVTGIVMSAEAGLAAWRTMSMGEREQTMAAFEMVGASDAIREREDGALEVLMRGGGSVVVPRRAV